MLVKRDHLISGLFDPSDTEDPDALWPEDDPMIDVPGGSGFRPAPRATDQSTAAENDGAETSSDVHASAPSSDEELEGSASGVPTPRYWSTIVSATTTPLPVVRATTEPTQRGLGIPPPPSAAGAEWLSLMPPLTSVAPLSLDAFDDDAKHEPRSPAGTVSEPTENERITVRAPANSSARRLRRRRAYAIAALALLGAVGAFLSHRSSDAEERTAGLARGAVANANSGRAADIVSQGTVDRPAPEPVAAEADALEAAPTVATNLRHDDRPSGVVRRSGGTNVVDRDARRADHEARIPPRHPEGGARPPRAAVPDVSSGLEAPTATEPSPEARHLSLPPR